MVNGIHSLFNHSSTHIMFVYTWRNSLCSPFSLCYLPFLPPLCPLPLTLAPSRCDRNCPPSPQVACGLTPLVPPTQLTHSPFPRSPNPDCPAPNNDDLGNILALDIQYSTSSVQFWFNQGSTSAGAHLVM
jgi:hypothetical protein